MTGKQCRIIATIATLSLVAIVSVVYTGKTTESLPIPTITNQVTNKPKKDFSNTRYADDFVANYRLEKSRITTDADKAFEAKWNLYVRTMANYWQQFVYGYDYSETETKFKRYTDDLKAYATFLRMCS